MADNSAVKARAGAEHPAGNILEARGLGADQNRAQNNWAKSPGSIAAFTIVFSIVAIACVYVLWRGPNRKVLPCIKRKKPASISEKEAEAARGTDPNGAADPENWRRTIVRENAAFPTRKSQAPGTMLPPDMYFDEKLSRQSTARSSLSNYTTSVYSQVTPSHLSNNRRSAGHHPGMATPEIAAPQAVHSPGMGMMGGDLFGLQASGGQRSTRSYLQTGPRASTASPSPAERSRASMYRKSTASSISVPFVPSPLAFSASGGPDDSSPRRPTYNRSRSSKRAISFVDDGQSMMDVRSTHSAPRQGGGRGPAGSSPSRGADSHRNSTHSMPGRMSLVPPGALSPHPPMPNLPWKTHAAPAVYYPAAPAPAPRASWNTSQAYISTDMYPSSYNTYANAPDFNPLPAGALAAERPGAHSLHNPSRSDSSGSDDVPPVPPLPAGASAPSLGSAFVPTPGSSQPPSPPRGGRASQAMNQPPSPPRAAPPQITSQPPSPPRAPPQTASPPRVSRSAAPPHSPPARAGRAPTAPGYSATSARLQMLSSSPPRKSRKGVSPPNSAEGHGSGSGSHDHTGGSSTTPASTMENYTTPTSSPPTTAPSSRNKHNHSPTNSGSSHGSHGSGRRKRGLWFESIDENHTMVPAGTAP